MLNVKTIKFERMQGGYIMPHLVLFDSNTDVRPETNRVLRNEAGEIELYYGFDSSSGLLAYSKELSILVSEYHGVEWEPGGICGGVFGSSSDPHFRISEQISRKEGVNVVDITINGFCISISVHALLEIFQEFDADKVYDIDTRLVEDGVYIHRVVTKASYSENSHCLFVRNNKYVDSIEEADLEQEDIFPVPSDAIEYIERLIDEALDNKDEKEFVRLTTLLKEVMKKK